MTQPRSRGFSLLEVLVALGIMAIVLPGLAGMFLGSKSSQVGSFATEQASQLAEGKLDSLRWLGRAMLVPKTTTPKNPPQDVGTWSSYSAVTLNGKAANWRWKFDTTIGVARRAGVLSVEVSWKQGKSDHSITLQGGVL